MWIVLDKLNRSHVCGSSSEKPSNMPKYETNLMFKMFLKAWWMENQPSYGHSHDGKERGKKLVQSWFFVHFQCL